MESDKFGNLEGNMVGSSAGTRDHEQPSSSPAMVSRMKLNDHKAGMDGLDRDKINKIIYEASKGSSFYKNELKKEEQVNRRIVEQHRHLTELTPQQILHGEIEADKLLTTLESERDLSRTIIHIDMDAFYAAVEMRDNPSLRNLPMAVGGNSMLSTSNYLARRYGVRAAMPGFIGRKLCPNLVIVPTNFDKYTAVSKQVRAIMAEYDPNYAPMSLDEAYLDITDHLEKRIYSSDEERTFKVKRDEKSICHCVRKATDKHVNEKTLSEDVCSQEKDASDASPLNLPSQADREVTTVPESDDEFLDDDGANGNQGDALTEENIVQYSDQDLVKEIPAIKGECVEEDAALTLEEVDLNMTCTDCGQFVHEYGSRVFGFGAEETVDEIRARIEVKTQLTASAGIAPNTMLSKVCSDKNKPNGQYRILPTREDVMEFISDLSIRKVSGIGKVSEKLLNALGVEKCSDLYHHRAILYHLYSRVAFVSFMEISLGLGSTRLESDSERKSMSVERTFREISKPPELYSKCQELCDSLSEDLIDHNIKGKTVTLKLKTVGFKQLTRAKTLSDFTNASDAIYQAISELLKTEIRLHNPLRLRLMGVRMSSFQTQAQSESKHEKNTIKGFFKTLDPNTSKSAETMATSSECSQSIATVVKETNNNKPIGEIVNALPNIGADNKKLCDEPVAVTMEGECNSKPVGEFLNCSIATCSKSNTLNTNNTSLENARRQNEASQSDGPSFNDGAPMLVCPVCNRGQPNADLEALNVHMDQCLNHMAIQELLNSDRCSDDRRTLPASKKRPNPSNKNSIPPRKKKKTDSGSIKIDKFFSNL